MKKRLWFVVSAVVDSGDDTSAEAVMEDIGGFAKAGLDEDEFIVIDIFGKLSTVKLSDPRFVDVFNEEPGYDGR